MGGARAASNASIASACSKSSSPLTHDTAAALPYCRTWSARPRAPEWPHPGASVGTTGAAVCRTCSPWSLPARAKHNLEHGLLSRRRAKAHSSSAGARGHDTRRREYRPWPSSFTRSQRCAARSRCFAHLRVVNPNSLPSSSCGRRSLSSLAKGAASAGTFRGSDAGRANASGRATKRCEPRFHVHVPGSRASRLAPRDADAGSSPLRRAHQPSRRRLHSA